MTCFTDRLLGNRTFAEDCAPPLVSKHLTAIIGNIGFVYDTRTDVLYVRIISSLKGPSENGKAKDV